MATAKRTQQDPSYFSIPASADLSAYQYRFMNVSSGQAALASAGGRVAGVLDNDPDAADEPAVIQYGGVALVMAAGSISSGGSVASDASGKAVAASGSANVCGIALADTDADEYCPVLLAGATAAALAANTETVTSGAVSTSIGETYLSVTGTQAYTLADGSSVGQRKRIECTVAATIPAGTLTINDAATGEPTSWVFNAVGQMIELEWTAAGWRLLTLREAGTDTPAAASTLNMLVRTHIIAIDGTDDWVLPSGEVPGQRQSFIVSTADNIPVGTISGLFYDEDGSADGVDINFNAIADMAHVEWDGLRWVPVSLTSATIS
jgi:hypothetical protein